MSTEKTADVGTCFEFREDGSMLPGSDRGTVDYMISLSAKWPDTYHQYVSKDGVEFWARSGREIPKPEFSDAAAQE